MPFVIEFRFFVSGSLWVSVVLNPTCDKHDRSKWLKRLDLWSKMDVTPLEDPDFHHDMLTTAAASRTSPSVSLLAFSLTFSQVSILSIFIMEIVFEA